MSIDGDYNYEGSQRYVIKNGIISGTQVPYVIEHNNYGQVVLESMRSNAEFIGQVDGLTGREETLGEMMEKSVKCAMWMKKWNVQPGDIIAICTHNHMDMYIPCFASVFVGAVFNSWWDIALTKAMVEHFLTLTKPKILFANEVSASLALQVADKIGMDLKIIVFGNLSGFESLENLLESQDSKFVPEFQCTPLSSSDDPAVIVYTSGTTGMPKGAVLSHKSLAGNLYIMTRQIQGINQTKTTMLFSPASWLAGVFAPFRVALVPETRIIYPEFKEEKTLELIEKYKINWMLLLPNFASKLQKCSAISKYDLSSVKFLYIAGTALKQEIQDAIAASFPDTCTILQGYGSTEIGRPAISQTAHAKPGSCGTITDNMMIKIVDPDTGKILGPNKIGVACLKSPYMMTCYYKNPEDTKNAVDDEGWLYTGDLLKYDEEGHFYFIDRMKEMIKFRGQHVSPSMIEQVLQQHPEVSEAAVIGIHHDDDDEHPIAFVVKKSNSNVTKEELEQMVSNTLPDYMALRGGVKFVEELPRGGSNKIARAKLRNLAKSYVI